MDHFGAFGLAPRPWIDSEGLRERFLRLSAEQHPDKARHPETKAEAEKRFASLNEAYNTLRNTRTRLLHLLALSGIASQAQVQSVPDHLADFFKPIAEQTRAADELVKRRAASGSPMLKVQLFEQGLDATASLQELQARLAERQREVEDEVRRADLAWDAGDREAVLQTLRSAAASLGFLERWRGQLQQRVAALAF